MVPATFWFGFFVLFKITWSSVIPTGRIVNGVNATYGEAQYVVSVRYNNYHECGGSIIGDRWVLTAAHCVFIDFVNVSTVLYGTKNIHDGKAPRGHTMKIKKAHVNVDYQPYGGYFNDIAIIEMEEAFVFDEDVNSVELPEPDISSPILKDSVLYGWGYSHVNGTVAEVLQRVDINIYPTAVCKHYFSSNFSEVSHICAGGDGKGQCTGDSGSALTVDGIQYGIVSWSDKPCATTPGVMTRVASFRNWITHITGI